MLQAPMAVPGHSHSPCRHGIPVLLLPFLLVTAGLVRPAQGLAEDARRFVSGLEDLQIPALMLTSMCLQLLLLATGGSRKWNKGLRLLAWLAYNASDAAALYCLGLMLPNVLSGHGHNVVYSLWGPILLLHLGAPDNITAYSSADAELWPRHGLVMLIQVGLVVYLISKTGRGPFLIVALCLLAAGSNKYAERTMALYYASRASVVKAILPIYQFMELVCNHTDLPEDGRVHYIVVGEAEWQQTASEIESETGRLFDVNSIYKTKAMVRFWEVQECKSLPDKAKDYLLPLCLGHALFKMLRRRISGLYAMELNVAGSREIFTHYLQEPAKVRKVLYIELRFLFDSIHTKADGTAFSRLGLCLRLLNVGLLTVSCFFLLSLVHVHGSSPKFEESRWITVTLLVVGLGIEVYQLVRIVLSDWTLVTLACSHVRSHREAPGLGHREAPGLGHRPYQLHPLLALRTRIGSLRSAYWRGSLRQVAMIQVHKHDRGWLHRLVERSIPDNAMSRKLLEKVMAMWPHVGSLSRVTSDKVKDRLTQRVLDRGREWSWEQRLSMAKITSSQLQLEENKAFLFGSQCDLEHAIMYWHIATCIFEKRCAETTPVTMADSQEPAADLSDKELAGYLSRYVLYLLVKKAELLPIHPDMGRKVYQDTVKAHKRDDSRGVGVRLGDRLKAAGEARWKLVADVWCDIVITIAVASKAQEHVEQLAVGGEFVTHLWVLLSHMGYT